MLTMLWSFFDRKECCPVWAVPSWGGFSVVGLHACPLLQLQSPGLPPSPLHSMQEAAVLWCATATLLNRYCSFPSTKMLPPT